MVLLVVVFSLIPGPPALAVKQGDKLQHLAAYFALMWWFGQVYRRAGERIACAVAFIGLGVALEFLQGATGWRTFDLHDMAANAAGVLLGWVVVPPRGLDVHARVRALFGQA